MAFKKEENEELIKDLSIRNQKTRLLKYAIDSTQSENPNQPYNFNDLINRVLPNRWQQRIEVKTFLEFLNESIKEMIHSIQKYRLFYIWTRNKNDEFID